MPQRNLNLRNTPIYKAPNGVINPILTPLNTPLDSPSNIKFFFSCFCWNVVGQALQELLDRITDATLDNDKWNKLSSTNNDDA